MILAEEAPKLSRLGGVEFLALLLATETNGRKPIMAVVRGRQEVGPRALGRARHGGDEREDEQIEVPEVVPSYRPDDRGGSSGASLWEEDSFKIHGASSQGAGMDSSKVPGYGAF